MEDKVIYSKTAELNVSNAEEKRIGTVYTKTDTSQQTGIEPSVPGFPGEEQQAEEAPSSEDAINNGIARLIASIEENE